VNNVPLIRNHVISYLIRLRSFVSCIDGNIDVVDRLRGPDGDARVARIVSFILKELGHGDETKPSVESENTQVRKAIARVRP
jgi:hypothetical protein